MPQPFRYRHGPKVYDLAVALAAVVGVVTLWVMFGKHIPVSRWLFWRYAGYWLLCLGWNTCILVFGHMLLSRMRRVAPTLEDLLFAMVLGVVAFYLVMFAVGALGLYGPVCFVLVPVGLFALGARTAFRFVSAHVVELKRGLDQVRPGNSWLSVFIGAFGLLALSAIYLSITVPQNVSFDSRWYHLGLAEQYVLAGGIQRFPQGWFMAAYPHLATYLYTWAFLSPGSLLVDRVLLAAHLEMLLFLWTLVGVSCLARALLGDRAVRLRHAWGACFLFPGIFLYDSSLCTGADHVAAFFAAPAYLALIRAWKQVHVAHSCILALCLAAAIGTKYSAVSLLIFPCAAFALRVLQLTFSRRHARQSGALAPLGVMLLAAFVGALVLAPHWAKNWISYGDPLYPMLHQYLKLTPWEATMDYRFATFRGLAWRPEANVEGVWETLLSPLKFSFVPHDWPWMHGESPVFGSLFTVSGLILPFFLYRFRRLGGLFLATSVGVMVWYWIQHEDRYLQALLPWMAAGTAATLALAWRAGWLSRVALTLLVGMQVVWGLHVYFIPTHGMLGQAPIKSFADRAAAVYSQDYSTLLRPFAAEAELGQLLQGGTLLLHQRQPILGLGVRVIEDNALNQGGLVYGNFDSAAALHAKLVSYGVTHVFYDEARTEESFADILVFLDFVQRSLGERTRIAGGFLGQLLPLGAVPPPFARSVLMYACPEDGYLSGIYPRQALSVLSADRRPLAEYPRPREALSPQLDRRQYLTRADSLILNTSCHPPLEAEFRGHFVRLGARGTSEMWRKRLP